MGGRRSRPLGSVGNIHWKEKLVYRCCLVFTPPPPIMGISVYVSDIKFISITFTVIESQRFTQVYFLESLKQIHHNNVHSKNVLGNREILNDTYIIW